MNMAVMRKDFRPQLEVRCCLENRGLWRVHENGIRFVHQVRVYQNSNRAVHCCCAICTDAESFLENRGGERRNCHVAGRKRYSRSRAHVLWLGARYSWLPRTVAYWFNRSEFCRSWCSTTAMSGMVGCSGKVMQKTDKRWRLSDEQPNIRQE